MSTWAAKRFWKDATVEESSGQYIILLDGRLVKTPAKATLKVPNAAMAQAIAEEWQAQEEKINPETMPNTCLLYTSPSPRDEVLSRMPSSA